MLEADGDKMWGGVFEARIEDVLHECNVNTKKPNILKKFSNWNESNCNLAKRVPYILDNPSSYLTTELSVILIFETFCVSLIFQIYYTSHALTSFFIIVNVKSCVTLNLLNGRPRMVKMGSLFLQRHQFI